MDLQFFLALNMMAVSALVALTALVNRMRGAGSWIAVNAAVVIGGLLSLALTPEWSGAIVGAMFVPLVLAPVALTHLSRRRAQMGRMREAARYAGCAALLHPNAQARFHAAVLEALSNDTIAGRLAALARLAGKSAPEKAPVLGALALAEQGRWSALLEHAAHAPAGELAALRLRALAEVGGLEDLARLLAAERPHLSSADVRHGQLFLMAAAGRPAPVDVLLGRDLAHLDAETKAYWRALAMLHSSGDAATGRGAMSDLARSGASEKMRAAAARHLAAPPSAGGAGISEVARAAIDAEEARIARAAASASAGWRTVPATSALIALNLAMFALEIASGGSEDIEVLAGLGALVPVLVTEYGEWWRLIAAMFLHFGPVHLAANMLMLSILGRLVETNYGWLKMLLIYVAGGLGSMATVMGLMQTGFTDAGVLLGASGAIFALFGAEVARQLRRWRRSRDIIDRRQLVNLGLIVLVQSVIDVSVPEISASAHISGLLYGFALGLILGARHTSSEAE